jgi:alkylated DNA repair dioxygenase AlkB
MDLFTNFPTANLLPFDGEVIYHGKILSKYEADKYFEVLMNTIEWKNDEAIILGKHIVTKRKVAWYGSEAYPYTYSRSTKFALPWTNELIQLKMLVEELSGSTYNSCLLNLYHNGAEGMAYHSDDEKALLENAPIASLSFGAERNFLFKHKKQGERLSLILEHGSLLVMQGTTQKNWVHRLPTSKKKFSGRINLTFRTIVN